MYLVWNCYQKSKMARRIRFNQSCVRPAGGKQQSTGLLHLVGFESLPNPMLKRKTTPVGVVFFWQRMRDSNPRKRSQSPVCYRYTNPLSDKHGYYYNQTREKVKHFFPFFPLFVAVFISFLVLVFLFLPGEGFSLQYILS